RTDACCNNGFRPRSEDRRREGLGTIRPAWRNAGLHGSRAVEWRKADGRLRHLRPRSHPLRAGISSPAARADAVRRLHDSIGVVGRARKSEATGYSSEVGPDTGTVSTP